MYVRTANQYDFGVFCAILVPGIRQYDFTEISRSKYDHESSLACTHNAVIRSHVILKTEERLHNSCTRSHMINTYHVTCGI